MRTLPLALRCYLGVTCIALLALAVLVGRTHPLVLALGLVPLGALPVAATALRQSEQNLRRAKEDAAVARRHGEQLEQVLAVGQGLQLPQTPVELLQAVAEAAHALLGASAVAAYVPDAADETLLERVALAPLGATEVGPTYASLPSAPLPAVQVTDQGRTLLVPLVTQDARVAGLLRLMGVPPGQSHAVLAFLARQAAGALQNAQLYERALAQAAVDGLTDLLNHRTFQARLVEEVARAWRGGHPLALLMIDLDDFRTINNTYGHQAGDTALTAVATALRQTMRASDVLARYGGDEFAVILPETTLDEALQVATRVHATITALTPVERGACFRVDASVGVAALPLHARTPEGLIHAADQAAYAAKGAGKGRVARPEEALLTLDRDPAVLARQLAHANLATVEALAAAVDAKNPGTHGHSQRVSAYAAAIAQALQLPTAAIARIRLAGLVHDVGKIGLPDAILTKVGTLTPEEAALVRRHPEIGEQLLAAVPFLREILPAVRHHHERWDGRGYPDGLVGAAIPRDAAILMVADAFDVLTSSRTDRPALPLHEAHRRLREESGTRFDPRIVAAVEQALADGTLVPLPSNGTMLLNRTLAA